MKAQWNWRCHFHINILPPKTMQCYKSHPPHARTLAYMATYNLGFIMGCCVSMGHASPLDSKKYQYRAVKSPHSKRNVRTIFLNKNPFFFFFLMFSLWPVVTWGRVKKDVQRIQENSFLSQHVEKRVAAQYPVPWDWRHSVKPKLSSPQSISHGLLQSSSRVFLFNSIFHKPRQGSQLTFLGLGFSCEITVQNIGREIHENTPIKCRFLLDWRRNTSYNFVRTWQLFNK